MCEMRRASGVEVNEIMIPHSHQHLLMIVLVKDGFTVKLCNTRCFFTVKTCGIDSANAAWILAQEFM